LEGNSEAIIIINNSKPPEEMRQAMKLKEKRDRCNDEEHGICQILLDFLLINQTHFKELKK
jgi:hypothetical protein